MLAAPSPPTPRRLIVGEGWKPIETAPRDGTEVLLWDEDSGGSCEVAFWSATHSCWLEDFTADPPAGTDVVGQTVYLPTHWMPLPPPPDPNTGRE